MSDDESNQTPPKIFNQYEIKLTSNMDYIKISIKNTNTYNIYESKFNLEYLQQYKLLMPNSNINEMIEFINGRIDENNIGIEENEKNLKLILISTITNYPNVELNLNKKNIIETLIKEIEGIKNENKILKDNYEEIKNKIGLIEEENKKLNNKIELIEKEKKEPLEKNDGLEKVENEEHKKSNISTDLIENDKEGLKNKKESIDNLEKKEKVDNEDYLNWIEKVKENFEEYLNKIEKEKSNYEIYLKEIEKIKTNNEEYLNKIEIIKKNNEEYLNKIELLKKSNEEFNNKKENAIINEIKDKIKILEGYHLDKIKIQLTKCNLQNINSIQPHNISVSTFPSGNIISVSSDKSIIIYDINLNILQNIQNAHDKAINYVEVKDENNFITCSSDESIKLWIKKENEFIINKIINNAHENSIFKVIYYSNENLISCSKDNKIKIWKENNNNYDNIKTLIHSDKVFSILYLEDKNILISSGGDGTKFWNLNKDEINYDNIDCIQYFEKAKCEWNRGLYRLDEDRIIVGRDSLIIISILNKIIIQEINILFKCWGIRLIDDKGIFLIGGNSKDIMIYRNDNYECIQIIQNAHDKDINGFVELKDGTILSYSNDKRIKIWNYDFNLMIK